VKHGWRLLSLKSSKEVSVQQIPRELTGRGSASSLASSSASWFLAFWLASSSAYADDKIEGETAAVISKPIKC